jgi:O-antigen ligase
MATLASMIPLRRELEGPSLIEWRTIARSFLLLSVPLIFAGAFLSAPLALLITMIVVAAVAWKSPVRGVYFLVAAAVLVETFPLGYPDSLTDRVPLFQNLSNVGVPGVAMSPLEVLMLEVSLIALMRRPKVGSSPPSGPGGPPPPRGGREASLLRGPIARAYLAFMGIVLLAELHGLATGGNFKLSLWELRPQVYGFVMFLLASSLLRTRRQLLTLGVVILCAVVFKAAVGTFRWQFTLGHSVTQDTLLGHEDSYFLVLFVVALLAALVWARRRAVLTPLLLATPVVTICLLANQRRVGLLALAAAALVMVVMLLKFELRIRARVVVLVALAAIAVGGFVAVNWNQTDGLAVQLVRPIRSLVDPSARDNSSDLYRVAENANLKSTFKQAPVTGLGFGMPFSIATPMADISSVYPLWNVIPHNSLLWVPMRMGIPGMVGFWGLIAMIALEAFATMRRTEDPVARAVAVFAVAAIVAELVVAYGDLQLESYRNLVFLGALVGAVAGLPRLLDADNPVRGRP